MIIISFFQILIGHVNDGIAIEEIGQRLLTALKQVLYQELIIYLNDFDTYPWYSSPILIYQTSRSFLHFMPSVSCIFLQKIGPGWVLYNLAGLYWRIIGNNYQGVECIRRSLTLVPDEYRDVPLVNLANILYRWGRFEDAVTVMKDALIVNDLEV